MTTTQIRFGVPADALVLSRFERTYFPAVAGQYHAGYLFEHEEMAKLALTEDLASPRRAFNIVAENAGEIVGFAAAVPSRLPGLGSIDKSATLLQYVAVDPAHRGAGIGRLLVEEIERRTVAARQDVILAHIPTSEAGFYTRIGWEVIPEGRGFAWLPFMAHLRADLGDPALGFPLMAAKILRPRALRLTFDFPVTRDAPIAEAAVELVDLIRAGRLDYRDLDEETRGMLTMSGLWTGPSR